MTSERYRQTLKSDRWKLMKWRVIMRQQFRCAGCKKQWFGVYKRDAMKAFQLHHRNGLYNHLGEEDFAEVEALCDDCHRAMHHLPQRGAA